MHSLSNYVSIHPYFQVHPGKLEEFQALLPAFVERTRSEEGNLYYEFTINGDLVFCREGYTDAAALLTHLANVEALLKQAMAISELARLELHGPAAELAKLHGPLDALKPAWFAHFCGVSR